MHEVVMQRICVRGSPLARCSSCTKFSLCINMSFHEGEGSSLLKSLLLEGVRSRQRERLEDESGDTAGAVGADLTRAAVTRADAAMRSSQLSTTTTTSGMRGGWNLLARGAGFYVVHAM